MKANRSLIKKYFLEGKSASEIFKLVKKNGIKRRFIGYWVKRFREGGTIEDAIRSGRPRSVRTKQLIKTVRERIRRNPERACRNLSRELNTSEPTMRRLLLQDLHLKCYKKRKLHGLSNNQKENRLVRSKELHKKFKPARWQKLKNLIFSDEKLFRCEQSYNSKNDVIYALRIEDIPENIRTIQRYQKSNSTMVWGALSQTAKLPLVFVNPGVKINAEYYETNILDGELMVWADATHGFGNWTFQQDSAPAHMARDVQSWCRRNCPDFISVDEWPASSPDLNPLDYSIWGILEERVNAHPHRSLDSLRRKLVKEWDKLSMNVVRAAIEAWPKRLKAVIKAKGGRFE